jgi:hypothetical protein
MAKVNTKAPCVVCGKLPDLPLLPWFESGPPWLTRTGMCRRCYCSRSGRKAHALHPELAQIGAAAGFGKKGRTLPSEQRAKISATLRSEESRRKLSAAARKRNLGRTLSSETRGKISAALRLRPLSPEHRAKISAARRGRPKSPTHIANAPGRLGHAVGMSKRTVTSPEQEPCVVCGKLPDLRIFPWLECWLTRAGECKRCLGSRAGRRTQQLHPELPYANILSGALYSEEARRKIGPAVSTRTFGRSLSSEHRARISDALRGVPKGSPSEETRRKISAATRGQKRSEETRAKIVAALRRRKLSEEARRNISAAARAKLGRPLGPEHRAKIGAANRAYNARKRKQVIETGISSRLTLRGEVAHDEGLRADHPSADHAGRGRR